MTELREPDRGESRLGWWFMRTFRPKAVAIRSARNQVVSEAWRIKQGFGDAGTYDRMFRALQDLSEAQDA